jgi:hypothetical protein
VFITISLFARTGQFLTTSIEHLSGSGMGKNSNPQLNNGRRTRVKQLEIFARPWKKSLHQRAEMIEKCFVFPTANDVRCARESGKGRVCVGQIREDWPIVKGGVTMMWRGLFVSAVAVFGILLFMGANSEGGDKDKKDKGEKKEPLSIKAIMKEAMGGKLCAKVAGGKADEAEKKRLIELFTDLATHTPPAGDEKDFKARTKALLDAAKADDGKALKKAADCKSCHDNYKKK